MRKFLFYLCFVLVSGCSFAQTKTILFNDKALRYEGRIKYNQNSAELSWSGNSVYFTFKGTSVSAILQDKDSANYYNVIVDGKVIKKIHTDTSKRVYLLANNLLKGKHTVQLFKRTEWDKGKTLFYGFEVPKRTKILPPPPAPKRKIEFYGNSITCGYAIEDSTGQDRWFGYFQNAYLTYAALTARHFNAEYSSISKSGIGIVISWFPLLMPEMYDRTDATDSLSKWDFNKYTPDIVVVNLFQNDSWLVNRPDHEQFKYRFGTQKPSEEFIIAAYQKFVASIRSKYPKAAIICALGSMDATQEGSPWTGYINNAITNLKDKNIYTCFFPFKNTGGHPIVSEQKAMAKQLIKFIETSIKW